MKFRVLFAVLLLCGLASAVSSSYDITLEENGKALAVLVLTGEGTINVPLPLDVASPIVEGGVYVKAENGIDVVVTETVSVIYKSDLMTLNQEGVWVFDLELPDTETSSVTLSLPQSVSIQESSPATTITQTEDSKNLLWTLSGENIVTVKYTMGEVPIEAPIQPGLRPAEPAPAGDNTLTIVIIILIVIVLGLFFVLKKKPSKEKSLTSGKHNVMRTLTDNEHAVVEALLKHPTGIKRNKLEKLTSISKSSLAGTLSNLENKNIISVDRSRNIHYISLTDWFSSL